MCSYFGWLKYCNSKNLLKKIESLCNIHYSNFNGTDRKISKFKNKTIKLIEIVEHNKYYKLHFIYKRRPISVNTQNKQLISLLKETTNPYIKL